MISNPKHSKLEGKTELIRKSFNLPSDKEHVIQDYRCSCNSLGSGKVYITENYVFFHKNINSQQSVAMRRMREVKREGKTLVLEEKDGSTYVFSGFTSVSKRDEAYHLVNHLLVHPYQLEHWEQQQNNNMHGDVGDLPPPSISVKQQQRVMSMPPTVSVLVDVESGQRALMKAQQAEAAGANTLMELERQREVINNMEADLNKMDDDLNMADRHLRGVEGIGGSLLNKVTSPTSPRTNRLSVNPSSKLVRPQSTVLQVNPLKHPNLTMDIVYKHPNDSLEQGTVSFLSDHFRMDVGDKEQGRWAYDTVESVVCRARPLHCDVVFRGSNTPRARFMSSTLQHIVNELVLRQAPTTLPVVFEKGSLSFPYNSALLRPQAREQLNEEALYQHMPEDVKAGIRIQDQQVDAIEDAAKNLQMMGRVMGEELDESIQQLNGLHHHMDDVNHHVRTANHRIEKLL